MPSAFMFAKQLRSVALAWLACSLIFGILLALLFIQHRDAEQLHIQSIAEKVHFELNSQLKEIDVFLSQAQSLDVNCPPETIFKLRQQVFKNPAMSEIGIVNQKGQLTCNSYGQLNPPIQTTAPIKADGLRYHGPIISEYMEASAFVLARTRGDGYEVNVLLPSDWLRHTLDLEQYSALDFIALVDSETGVPIILQGGYSLPLKKPLFPVHSPRHAQGQFDDGKDKFLYAKPLASLPKLTIVASSDSSSIFTVASSSLTVLGLLYVFVWAALSFLHHHYELRQLSLKSQLKQAIAKQQLFNVYQPLIDARTQQIVGVEVLIRWQHPTEGELGPAYFIPEAERSGAIVEISIAQVNTAVEELKPLLAQNPNFKVSFNVNGQLLSCKDYLSALYRAHRQINALTIELTERDVLSQNQVKQTLEQLVQQGIEVAVDDFGTGYSGLQYLQSFPIDLLKIDQSFVASIGLDNLQSPVLNAVIEMANKLDKKLIAEGVETPHQAAYLLSKGVTVHQGWCYYKALKINALTKIAQTSEKFSTINVSAA
ncbi:EAL domain-containing protein [Pseudoalteromonas sp. S16_S37]|uniref:EAL domain-containing protein n=1 Tax=Pseudoalteromonas sp. S16_S37 TaxID=2720228 RepID=UPI0016805626|nr:EAL domain-containing protein [Pseudoalteromonas sp. S16_S37]MBD1581601.1 EAL domain-containing protein [Pseudoalteromonas sp. S16_S37]